MAVQAIKLASTGNFTRLKVVGGNMDRTCADILIEAMQTGGLSSLTELVLEHVSMTGDCVMALSSSLGHSCPRLETLSLNGVRLKETVEFCRW